MKKTDSIQQKPKPAKPLDPFDRKILSALAENADQSYQDLGALVGLSAPAVHERVKRLKADKRIRGTAALLDGNAIDKPLLAFVHVNTKGWGKSQQLMQMAEFPELEEIHSVAGDTCMLLKVRVASSDALEGLLERIYAMPSVVNTRSYVVLSTYLERPIQGGVTTEFAEAKENFLEELEG